MKDSNEAKTKLPTETGFTASAGSESLREMPWARCQNMVALLSFAAVVIAAPGNWKWACIAIAGTYLSKSDSKE